MLEARSFKYIIIYVHVFNGGCTVLLFFIVLEESGHRLNFLLLIFSRSLLSFFTRDYQGKYADPFC